MNEFLSQFTTMELLLTGVLPILGCVIVYLIRRMKKLSFDYYTKNMSQTLEKWSSHIIQLEEQIKVYQRDDTGVVAQWEAPKENTNSYVIQIYNDSPEKVFNVQVEVESKYRNQVKILWKQNAIEAQKDVRAYFVPGGWNEKTNELATDRARFLEVWLNNGLKPIQFTVKYTKTPASQQIETVNLFFEAHHISGHLKRRLAALQARGNLKALPTPSKKT